MSTIYLPTPRDGVCGPCGDDPCGKPDPYTLCGIDIESRGGGAGYSQSFDVPQQHRESGVDLSVRFETWDVPDRLRLITADGVVLYDSGYVGTLVGTPWFVEATVTVPPGVAAVTVEVTKHPDYAGTVWALRITCLDTAP